MTYKRLRQAGIYCIRNLVNGKLYIGSSIDLRRRLIGHRYSLKRGRHANVALQSAWVKYGSNAFSFEVLMVCSETECLAKEKEFIDRLHCVSPCGYNIRSDVTANYGLRHTAEARLKISLAGRGRKLSPEHCKAIGDAHRGTKHTVETKRRISQSLIGVVPVWIDPVGRALKISQSRTGYVMPHKTKRKLSKIFKGKSMLTEDTKTKIRSLFKGGTTRRDIGKLLGIDKGTVGNLIAGRTR